MAIPFRSPAIVLKRSKLREADRIVTFYTRNQGKVAAVARGVRKVTSKLGGHLEMGSVVDLSFVEGRGELYTVTAVQGGSPMVDPTTSLNLLPTFTHILEVVDRLTHEGEPDSRLFDLLAETMRILRASFRDLQPKTGAIRAVFDLQFLKVLGLLPEVQVCVVCRAELYPVEMTISLRLGGVLCPNCQREDREALILHPDLLKLLRYFSTAPASQARTVYLPARTEASLLFVLDRLFAFHLSDTTSSSVLRASIARLDRRMKNV